VNLALFDFDGTITTREMFPDFMRFSVAPRRLAMGKVLLAPWIGGYRMGVVSGNRVRSRIVGYAREPRDDEPGGQKIFPLARSGLIAANANRIWPRRL
jgi:hypothetical protein